MGVTATTTRGVGRRDHEVDALRLLRLVHARRALRLLIRVVLLAGLAWMVAIAFLDDVQSEPGSPVYWMKHSGAFPLLVFVGVPAAAVVGQIALGRVDRAGRVAAAVVPVLGRARVPEVEQGERYLGAVVRMLSRQPFIRFGSVLLLVIACLTAYAMARETPGRLMATFGSGGPEVVIGEDASVTGREVDCSGRGCFTTYFLGTPYGQAVALWNEPEPGEHFVILRDDDGSASAYKVGWTSFLVFLVIGGIGLIALVAALLTIGVMISRIGDERRRRAGDSDAPLVDSVEALMRGHRAVLRVWKPRGAPPLGAGSPTQRPRSAPHEGDGPQGEYFVMDSAEADEPIRQGTLGLPSTSTRTAAEVLRQWRRSAVRPAVAVVAGIVLMATPFGLVRAGVIEVSTASPDEGGAARRGHMQNRYLTLGYLAPTSWDTRVYASYDEVGSLYTDPLLGGESSPGAEDPEAIERAWRVLVDTPLRKPEFGAYLKVFELRRIPGRQAVANFIAHARTLDESATDVSGLPPGWKGVLVDSFGDSQMVKAAGHAQDLVITIEVEYQGDAPLQGQPRHILTRRLKDLVGAIAERGLIEFAADTDRKS